MTGNPRFDHALLGRMSTAPVSALSALGGNRSHRNEPLRIHQEIRQGVAVQYEEEGFHRLVKDAVQAARP
jgi:hypothetical protein